MKNLLLSILIITSLNVQAQRNQFVWSRVMKNGTANKFAGWDASGNPVEKSGSGGISNSAASNEIAKSDGTNIVPSGLFQSGSIGDLDFGNSSTSGVSRSIGAVGSSANISFNVNGKGTGGVHLSGGDFLISTNGGASTTQCVISTADNATHNTQGILIATGNNTSGTGKAGDITITNSNCVGCTRGYLIIQNLPTSNAGLPSGAVWNNSGVLSIAP